LQLEEIFQAAPLGIPDAVEIIRVDEVNEQASNVSHEVYVRNADLCKTDFRKRAKEMPERMSLRYWHWAPWLSGHTS
jgi:hypothetical protein